MKTYYSHHVDTTIESPAKESNPSSRASRVNQLSTSPTKFVGEKFSKVFMTNDDTEEGFDEDLQQYSGVVVMYDPITKAWNVKYDADHHIEQFDKEDMTHFVIDEFATPLDWKNSPKEQKRKPFPIPTSTPIDDTTKFKDPSWYVNKPIQASVLTWAKTNTGKKWAQALYGDDYSNAVMYGWVVKVNDHVQVASAPGKLTYDTQWSDNTTYTMDQDFVHKASMDYVMAPITSFSVIQGDDTPPRSTKPQLLTIQASSIDVEHTHLTRIDILDTIQEKAEEELAKQAIDEGKEVLGTTDEEEDDDEHSDDDAHTFMSTEDSEENDEQFEEDDQTHEYGTDIDWNQVSPDFDSNILGNKVRGDDGKFKPIKRDIPYTKVEKRALHAELKQALLDKSLNKTWIKGEKKRISRDIKEPSIVGTRWVKGKNIKHPPPNDLNNIIANHAFEGGQLKGLRTGVEAKDMNYAELFVHFLSPDAVRRLCTHTQAEIRVMQSREYSKSDRPPFVSKFVFDEAKFYKFLACLMFMQAYPQHNRQTYWLDKILAPLFSTIMSFTDFDIIARSLTLVDPSTLDKSDPFGEIRSWMESMNMHFKLAYESGGLLTGDESMSKQTQVGVPGYKVIIRKPNSRGHEFHTVADAISKILMHCELYEGKEAEKKKKYGVENSKYQAHTGTTLRMLEWCRDAGKVVILDAGFGSWETVNALHDFGIYAIANVKGCHKHFCKMWMLSQLKKRGDTCFATATFQCKETNTDYSILASGHCDRQPMCLISTCGRGDSGRDIKRARFYMDTALKMQKFVWSVRSPDTHALYREYFNVIDLINRGREAGTALHDIWVPQDWIKRLFSTTIGFVEGNALNAHNQLHPVATSRTEGDAPTPTTCAERIATTFAERRKVLAEQLVLFANTLETTLVVGDANVPKSGPSCFDLLAHHTLQPIPRDPTARRRRLQCSFCKIRTTHYCTSCEIVCCPPFNGRRTANAQHRACYATHMEEVQTGKKGQVRKRIQPHLVLSPTTKRRVNAKRASALVKRRRTLVSSEIV